MMKKYMAAGIVAISVLGATTGCGFTGGKDIGKDAALEAALQDAGVTKEEATRLKTSKDRDDGRMIYEIQFDANGTEYDYEIAAEDGTILTADTENVASNTAAQNKDTQGNESAQEAQMDSRIIRKIISHKAQEQMWRSARNRQCRRH